MPKRPHRDYSAAAVPHCAVQRVVCGLSSLRERPQPGEGLVLPGELALAPTPHLRAGVRRTIKGRRVMAEMATQDTRER